MKILMLYGMKCNKSVWDRGRKDYENRIADLCLDEDTIKRISFRFVEKSCHMPMLENSSGLINIINSMLNENNEIKNIEKIR